MHSYVKIKNRNNDNKQYIDDYGRFLPNLALPIMLFFFMLSATTLSGSVFGKPEYQLRPDGDALLIHFSQSWSFDLVELPSVSKELWGDTYKHRAATIVIAGRSFISKLSDNEHRLIFNLRGTTGHLLQIMSIFKTSTVTPTGDPPEFVATPARIRKIEDELKELAESVLNFQRRNSCFSCHTALPLVLACKVATVSGLRIPTTTLNQIGNDIAAMQSYNGIYSFPRHPDYGIIAPTLCAGAIMAIISDISSQYLDNLQKIRLLLPDWLDDDGLLKSDFYFRPLFIGNKTNMLFEAVILQVLYLYRGADGPEFFDEDLHKRLTLLRQQATFAPDEPIHRQILSMAGTPILFQFTDAERPLIIRQLLHLLNNEPEGERASIRALAIFLLSRFSPGMRFDQPRKLPTQNLGDEIWACFEKLVTSLPTEAKNTEISADSKEQ